MVIILCVRLKLPLEIERKLIDISNPVYTFCEVMDREI